MDIYGAELEATWIPIDQLNLQAQVGYLHADYRKFTESIVVGGQEVVIDRSKDHPPFSPEWTMRLGAAYTFELGDKGGLTLSTDILYRDKQWLSVDNRDVLTQDAYTLWNVLLSWASPSNALVCVGRREEPHGRGLQGRCAGVLQHRQHPDGLLRGPAHLPGHRGSIASERYVVADREIRVALIVEYANASRSLGHGRQ